MISSFFGFSPRDFWGWADRRQFLSVRAFVLYATVFDTWYAFEWASRYAFMAINRPGAEVAMVIGAVTAPVAVMQAFIFKWYTETRGTNPTIKQGDSQ